MRRIFLTVFFLGAYTIRVMENNPIAVPDLRVALPLRKIITLFRG